jgi:predicted phage terminase large subunit-like protein
MNAKNSAVRVGAELAAPTEMNLLALAREDLACYALANYPAFQLPRFLELVTNMLEAVERAEVKRLVLSLPPRHGKSLLASTYFPAWYLGRHPERYVIAASYGQELADDFGRRVRNTVQSPLHGAIFPESRLSDDSAAVHRFNLTASGAYFAVGRGAAITGRGAHLLLIDDPLKDAEEANSPTIRRSLQQWFSTVAFTRLMPDAAVVIIATRWHESDLCGWLLNEYAAEGWQALSLPAIAEANDPIGRAEGEPLWPERYPLQTLESIRRQLGSAAFASLYQQRPAPIEGRMFRREWWRFYSAPPASFTQIVMSVDSAFKTGQETDYSAFTIWGNTRSDGIYLLHAWRDRVEFPELKRKVKEFADQWRPNAVLVEDKASGQSLIQELKRDTNLPIIAVKVDKDKVTRAAAVTPLVEAGKVLLPERAGWLDDYLDELSTFPSAAHDDYVDSTTQALTRLSQPVTGAEAGLEFLRMQVEKMYAPEHEAGHRSHQSECPGNDCPVLRDICETARSRRWR